MLFYAEYFLFLFMRAQGYFKAIVFSFSNWLLRIIKDISSRANMNSLKKYREKDDTSRVPKHHKMCFFRVNTPYLHWKKLKKALHFGKKGEIWPFRWMKYFVFDNGFLGGIHVKKYSELKILDLFYWRHLNFFWPLP